MALKHMKIWSWLLVLAAGLIWLKILAPLSSALEEILSGVVMAILLAFCGSYYWQKRRERQANQSSSAAISSGDQM